MRTPFAAVLQISERKNEDLGDWRKESVTLMIHCLILIDDYGDFHFQLIVLCVLVVEVMVEITSIMD